MADLSGLRSHGVDYGLDLPPRPTRLREDELASPNRLLRLFRDSYATAQGRQWLQPHVLWWVLSLLRDHGVRVEWPTLLSPDLADTACELAVPRGHVPVIPPEQTAMNFRLWWQLFIDIATYVNRPRLTFRCALPTSRVVAERAHRLGLRPWMSSATPEELAGIGSALTEIRRYDRPAHRASVDAVMTDVLLAKLLVAEAYWLLKPDGRPSTGGRRPPGEPNRDLMLTRQHKAAVEKSGGEHGLSPFDHLYLRAGDLTRAIATAPVDGLPPPLRPAADALSAIHAHAPELANHST